MSKKGQNPNEGHRGRLRKRFERSGFDGFHDYEILELLLTYAIPRIDTKPLAKSLLKRFGTLPKVLDNPVEKLKKVEGIGDNTALFLRILRETISEHFKGMAVERRIFKTLDELIDYLRAIIGGRENEMVHVLYLNSKNELIY